jgi:hypothetical protein
LNLTVRARSRRMKTEFRMSLRKRIKQRFTCHLFDLIGVKGYFVPFGQIKGSPRKPSMSQKDCFSITKTCSASSTSWSLLKLASFVILKKRIKVHALEYIPLECSY